MPSTQQQPAGRKQIRLGVHEQIGVGIDVHKKTFAVCLWSRDEDREIKRWSQPADPDALVRKLEPLREQIIQIAYEAGPSGFVLARHFQRDAWPVIVTSPADMPTSRNEPKSDRKDARKLARLAAKNMLPRCHVPTVEHEDERRIVRMRGRVLVDKNRWQLRIKSLLLNNGIAEPDGLKHWSAKAVEKLRTIQCTKDVRFCLNMCLNNLQFAREQLGLCDHELDKLAQRQHNWTDIVLLKSIPGIGIPTALHFMVEMGPRGRFHDRIELSKYQGLSPEVRSSGQSRDELQISLSGNRYLRTLLVEAAWRWIRYDDNARALYARMMCNTGNSQKAITAVARKLGILMWHLREKSIVYDTHKLQRN